MAADRSNEPEECVGIGIATLNTGKEVACAFHKKGGKDIAVIHLARNTREIDQAIAALEMCRKHFVD